MMLLTCGTKRGLLDHHQATTVQKYVEDRSFELHMRTKAESDPVVAAASIIARATWLQQMKKLEEFAGRSIPKGSGAQAKEVAGELFSRFGEAKCMNFARCILRPRRGDEKFPCKEGLESEWKTQSLYNAKSKVDP